MIAIVEIAKKQYLVKQDEVIRVQRLPEQDKTIIFDKVLVVADEKNVQIGTPYVHGARVEGQIQSEEKGDKVIIGKFKRRKKYRRKRGHRQIYTVIKITRISE